MYCYSDGSPPEYDDDSLLTFIRSMQGPHDGCYVAPPLLHVLRRLLLCCCVCWSSVYAIWGAGGVLLHCCISIFQQSLQTEDTFGRGAEMCFWYVWFVLKMEKKPWCGSNLYLQQLQQLARICRELLGETCMRYHLHISIPLKHSERLYWAVVETTTYVYYVPRQ